MYPDGQLVVHVKLLSTYEAAHCVQLSAVEPKQNEHLLSQSSQTFVSWFGNFPGLQTYLQVLDYKYNPETHEWQSEEVNPLQLKQVSWQG